MKETVKKTIEQTEATEFTENGTTKNSKYILTIVKYVFSFLLVLATAKTTRSISHTITALLELAVLITLFDLAVRKHRFFSWLGSIMILIFNAENVVMFFSGSFVTYVMLENIDSIQDLAGKAIIYGLGAAAGIGFSFLPVYPIRKIKWKISGIVCVAALVIEIVCIGSWGVDYSPICAVADLYEQGQTQASMHAELDKFDESVLDSFYKAGEMQALDVADTEEHLEIMAASADENVTEADITEDKEQPILDGYVTSGSIQKYSCTMNRPNIILIFTEGLSQNVIDDEREIMPNAKSLQQQSLSFKNYYNHTFATYRGLIGQMYSGYQLEDYDSNNLISMADIMKGQGYYTSFVNTEPNNSQFSSYLSGFGFDEVISDLSRCNGVISSMSDADAYDLLFEMAQQYDEQMEQPFFMAIYTFGTHTTFDSIDENVVFGDGTNRVLNRFYYADIQLGQFLDNFKNSSLASDTVLVFTSDHCTYADADYLDAFPEYNRKCTDLDQIPFYIYYVGGTAATLNALGRNSLDMVPTVLDFLNISEPNYFLGESLFKEKTGELGLDTIFYDPAYLYSTDGGEIHTMNSATEDYVLARIQEYFAAKSQNIN